MFGALTTRTPRDRDLPERAWRVDWLRRVLRGTMYDDLTYEFHQEHAGDDGSGDYVPISDRRPSVRYNLCRLVVEDTTGLLFGEGRFPTVQCEDETVRETLADLVKEACLNRVMIDAARRGSVGSVCLRMRVLKGRVYVDALDTTYLTPEWQDDAPEDLARVTERRKARGDMLRDQGYAIADEDMATDFWFVRYWDATDEVWLIPTRVSERKPPSVRDTKRSVTHRLGFVPLVWIRNLPGADDIDGACTFAGAIETQIEIEYQLSQAGRGLKYSSDPTLLIKEPAAPDAQLVRSASSAIVVSEKGDAKMLEIGGTAAAAVIEYVRTLREYALESIHGNRSAADKVSAAQSGKALELLHQPLIGLADNLRISYGEEGLLRLLRMIVAASAIYPLTVAGKKVSALSTAQPISLNWAPFFSPTFNDQVEQATALGLAIQGGFLSPETALREWAQTVDIEDEAAELTRIQAHAAAQAEQAIKLKAAGPKDPGAGSVA